jgi:hypothetical protein
VTAQVVRREMDLARMQAEQVTGETAVIVGTATLNGTGGYAFRLTAIDNGEPGHHDALGLAVRDPAGAVVVDLTFAAVALTGGNIQVHK